MLNTKTSTKNKNHKYRVDITNDDTYSHVMTFHISSKTFGIVLVSSFLGVILLTIGIIAFSPLKYYMPGLSYVNQEEELLTIRTIVDSLQQKIEMQDKTYNMLQIILKNDLQGIAKYDSIFFDNYSDANIETTLKDIESKREKNTTSDKERKAIDNQ